jgi:cell division protein FtsB
MAVPAVSRGAHSIGRTGPSARKAPVRSTPKPKSSKAAPKPAKSPKSAKSPKTARSAASARTKAAASARTKAAASARTKAATSASAPKAAAGLRFVGPAKPSSPKADRARPKSAARRHRVPVAAAAVFALVLLATSFPLAGLLSQHRQLSAAAAQLSQLRHTNRSLAEQQRQLNSPTAIQHLARARYQLVLPGHTLYDVLPPGGQGATTTPGASTSGDPGNQPLVPPADAPDLSPDPNISTAQSGNGNAATTPKPGGSSAASGGSGRTSGPTTFWSRVADSLQFWR